MKPQIHGALSAPFGAGLYALTGDGAVALCAALSSVLIDIDHVMDYILERRKTPTINSVYSHFMKETPERFIFILHSWEFIAAMIFVSAAWDSMWLEAVALGMAFHISMDTLQWCFIDKRIDFRFYFLLFRARRRFRSKLLLNIPERLPVVYPDS